MEFWTGILLVVVVVVVAIKIFKCPKKPVSKGQILTFRTSNQQEYLDFINELEEDGCQLVGVSKDVKKFMDDAIYTVTYREK